MGLDSTEEILSHFIGMFDLTIEELRLRDQYQEFTALRRQAELEEIEGPINADIKAPLDPKAAEFDPTPLLFPVEIADIQFPPPDTPGSELPTVGTPDEADALPDAELMVFISAGRSIQVNVNSGDDTIVVSSGNGATFFARSGPDMDFQGSVYSMTKQLAFLTDIDTLGSGDFRSIEAKVEQTILATEVATSLHLLSGPLPDLDALRDFESVEALAASLLADTPISIPGAVVHSFAGEDANGTFVNGESVDELPVWADLLPAFHQEEDSDGDAASLEKDAPEQWDRSDPGDEVDGHTVITGGNLQINESLIQSAWLDAPYIAVGGKTIDLAVISQVAVVSDIDIGESAGQGPGTEVVQAAQIDTKANVAPWLQNTTASAAGPAVLTLDKIEGDLIIANFVQQTIETLDTDQIGATISASETYWSLGDNQVINLADIAAFGSNYDLILIGEDMISVDMLFQTQVLMDSDRLEAGPAPMPLPASEPAPLLASATAGAQAFEGIARTQDDISGPDFDAPSGRPDAGADDAPDLAASAPTVSGGDNTVANVASLTTIGEDIHADISNTLSDILANQSTSAEALEAALLSDPHLAGLEQVRALQIEGNLIQVNIVEQMNILSDQDDVLIDGGLPDGAEIIAGSNAMLNAAQVIKSGVDSVVMAQTEGYSDLLIHQASLIDEPDVPTAEETSEYINEALVALMDDVPGVDDIAAQVNSLVGAQDITASDPLHTMLS